MYKNVMQNIYNPILSGFYPDPSICRVKDAFYLITSSFSYFPAIPIFRSKNLVQWEQIGHVLDRPEQIVLNPNDISMGIFAPTIRWHKGVFYVITTNITTGKNFIVTTSDPMGPWSAPHILEGWGGIDPSLYWDDNGKMYLTGTADFLDPGPPMITLSELDPKTYQLIGEKKRIWGGALHSCASPEAPHIYKKDGYYYLMISEGGTEHYHAITIARSKEIEGEYEGYVGNPILTHRHLGVEYPISCVGHGDLVELQDGSWYMVMLASRPYGGYHKNMGRETFIAPVVWENGWPVVSPGTGKVESHYQAPVSLHQEFMENTIASKIRDEFADSTLSFQWNFIGVPDPSIYKLENGHLKLKASRLSIGGSDKTKPDFTKSCQVVATSDALSFVGRRQQHMRFKTSTRLLFQPEKNAAAGLAIIQNNYHQLRIELRLDKNKNTIIRVVQGYCSLNAELTHKWSEVAYQEKILCESSWNEAVVILGIEANDQEYTLTATNDKGTQLVRSECVHGGFLGSETAGGFVGAYIGMFATGNGEELETYAEFDWFNYEF